MKVYSAEEKTILLSHTERLLANTNHTKQDVEILRKAIEFNEHQYYILDAPTISDSQYDALFKALLNLEKKFPELINTSSPSQRVGDNNSNKFASNAHLVPMLSLQNTYNETDLIDWDTRIKVNLNHPYNFSIEPKYDGASISLVYENDILIRAVTRGNGLEGDNVTQNVYQINNIPQYANFSKYKIDQIEIRGEVLMSKQSFIKNNEDFMADNKAAFVNARNAASGTLRMKDSNEVKKRNLTAFMYHISFCQLNKTVSKPPFETHYQCLQMLNNLGFPIVEKSHFKIANNIQDVINYCKTFEVQRNNLNYEIDGMVIKINTLQQQEILGMTTHHPRWAVAYKFTSYQSQSILQKVEYQIGRTGVISPVAKILPTQIGGVTIASISIFNENNIQEKDLKIGDTIIIERAGDVIPNIIKSIKEKRTGTEQSIIFPTQCPQCKSTLIKNQDEAHWRCPNYFCEAQVVERMIYFCSKDAMDIQFLGEAKIQKFFALGYIKNINDLYHLPFDEIKNLEGFGEKTILNLQIAIEQSKKKPLTNFLLGIGIPFVGKATTQTLCNAILHLFDLKKMTAEQLQLLEDVGPKVANSIIAFFENKKNINLLNSLEASGLNFISTKKQTNEGASFYNKTFLFTGTLTFQKRSDAEAKVKMLGGDIAAAVSSKLHYLIVGEDAGSKLEKAKKIGTIKILSEQEFEQLLSIQQI